MLATIKFISKGSWWNQKRLIEYITRSLRFGDTEHSNLGLLLQLAQFDLLGQVVQLLVLLKLGLVDDILIFVLQDVLLPHALSFPFLHL